MAENTFKILISTDNHLGYMEKDGVRGRDSFVTFEEVLKIGVEEDVDFILLGGDLFHENKPSISAIHQCMALLRKYTLGDRAVPFEFLSDPKTNFGHSRHFPWVNYEDANLNVAIPVFSIHGNHDDPMGPEGLCALDLFSASGLVNFFGKHTSVQRIEMSPILLRKGTTRLALYGLGAVRDERLHRMFTHNQVAMLRPAEDRDAWFSLLVVHQNRSKHGPTNYLPERFLDDFLDLVVWGHEHDCRIEPEWNDQQNFYVTQPGSSVATSLSEGEASPKHVGVLEVRGREFKLRKVPLRTVRPFQMDDLVLEDVDELSPTDPHAARKVEQFCRAKVDELIERAGLDHTGDPRQPQEPLIRLRVDYSGGFESFSALRFGQAYVEQVANPKELLLFHRRRERAKREDSVSTRTGDAPLSLAGASGRVGTALDAGRVEDLVRRHFEAGGDRGQLALLTERDLGLAVHAFVDKDARDAIGCVVDAQLTRVRRHLASRRVGAEEEVMQELERLRKVRAMLAEADGEPEPDDDVARALREAQTTAGGPDADSDDDPLSPSTSTISTPSAAAGRGRGGARGRGRGRAAAPRRGGGRGSRGGIEAAFAAAKSSQIVESDHEAVISDGSDDDVVLVGRRGGRRAAAGSRGGRGGRKRAAESSDDSDDRGFAAIRRRKR